MEKYRNRIYQKYINIQDTNQIPIDLDGLRCRIPTMKYVIKEFFPKEKKSLIIDLGCGHGTLVHYSQQAGYINTKGFDISSEQVQLANQLGIAGISQCNLKEALAKFPSNSLDMVITIDVIEHLTKGELMELVDSIYAVLKINGSWLIHGPNGRSPFVGSVRFGDFTHEQAFTPASLNQLLKASGFSRLDFSESGPHVHGLVSFVRAFLWRIARNIFIAFDAVETGSLQWDSIWTRNFYTLARK